MRAKQFCGDNEMLKAAKRILSQIRGLIIKDKEDQTPVTASAQSEPVESSSPAPAPELPLPNVPITDPLPPADPISDSPPLEFPRPDPPFADGILPKPDPL